MSARPKGTPHPVRPAPRRLGRLAALAVALGAVAVASRRCRAQDESSRAGILLTLPTSTRALGLGDAASAAAPDEWATFASPAQLALLRGPSAGASTEGYLASTRLSAVAVAVPLARGTIGIGATLLDYGSIQEIATSAPGTDGTETGRTLTAQDDAIIVAYGAPVGHALRIGGAVEFISTRVADVSGSAVAASAGFAWSAPRGWDVAGAVQHAGSNVSIGATTGALPLTARVAVAVPSCRLADFVIRPVLEVRHIRGGGTVAAGAGEASWSGSRGVTLRIRGGYTLHDDKDDRWPVSLGAGATFGPFTLDYALERFPTINQVTHRVGLRFTRSASR